MGGARIHCATVRGYCSQKAARLLSAAAAAAVARLLLLQQTAHGASWQNAPYISMQAASSVLLLMQQEQNVSWQLSMSCHMPCAAAASSITYYRHAQRKNYAQEGMMYCMQQLLLPAAVLRRVVLYSSTHPPTTLTSHFHGRHSLLVAPPAPTYTSNTHFSPLLHLLVCAHRPGAADGLNPATLQYSVVSPSATPAIGTPLAISVARKGSSVPLFDTTGQRWVNGCRVSLFAAWSVELG
jgi:hypothetical protein